MLLIPCPWCGPRDEHEFSYGGEAHIARPTDPYALDDGQWADYLFMRSNPKGMHLERWMHAHGCRRWFNVARDTVSHEIAAVYKAGEKPPRGIVATRVASAPAKKRATGASARGGVEPVTEPTATPAAKTAQAGKPPASKTTARKTTKKKTVAGKPATKKTVASKATARKSAAGKTTTRKRAARKPDTAATAAVPAVSPPSADGVPATVDEGGRRDAATAQEQADRKPEGEN